MFFQSSSFVVVGILIIAIMLATDSVELTMTMGSFIVYTIGNMSSFTNSPRSAVEVANTSVEDNSRNERKT